MSRLLIVLCLLVAPGAVSAEPSPEPLVRRALEAHPRIEGLEARVEALEHGVDGARALPEPVLALEYSNMPVDAPYPGVHPMSGVQLRVQQGLLAPGTRPLREQVAYRRVAVGEAAVDEARATLAAAVRTAYWQLALIRQQRELTVEHLALVDELVGTVRASYEVGGAGQHELLNLWVLRGQLEDQLGEFDRRERELLATLGAALDTSPPPAVETPARTPASTSPGTLDDLLAAATSGNPTLARLVAQGEAERAAAAAAGREAWPDAAVWAGYRVRAPVGEADDGANQVSVGISVPLPTSARARWGAQEAAHGALARASDADAASILAGLRAGLDGALARLERANDKAILYRDSLIPDARDALDATLSAYRVGRADFASLFAAQLQLLDLERAVRDADVQAALATVEIQRWLGVAELDGEGRLP